MPAKVLIFALLLSCSGLAVTGLSLMEEPSRDLPIREPTPLIISKVIWTTMGENTTLQFCADEDIPGGQAVLVWGVVESDGKAETIEEKEDDGEAKCSTFQMKPLFRLPAELTFYQLSVELENAIGFAAVGSIEFAMTAQKSILVCGELRVTKLSWAIESPITYTGCIKTEATPFATDCYIEQSFSNQDLCFDLTIPPVKVCLNGPIGDVPSGGELSVNYLEYGEPAVLSLNYVNQDLANMRAIVRLADDPAVPGQPGLATVYECPGGLCTLIAGTIPVYKTYQVCGEARAADGPSLQTATAKIIDLNLVVFVGGTEVLEFAFANGLENRMYTASLLATATLDDPAVDTISVDCTEVEADNACFGFFSTPTVGTLYVALAEKTDDSNQIIATYTPAPISEQAQVHRHGP